MEHLFRIPPSLLHVPHIDRLDCRLSIFMELEMHKLINYSREEQLWIRQQTPEAVSHNFRYPGSSLEGLIEGAATVCCKWKHRRGKWAGVLVRRRYWRFCMLLPAVHLVDVRSLPNKIDKNFPRCCPLLHRHIAQWSDYWKWTIPTRVLFTSPGPPKRAIMEDERRWNLLLH